MPVMVVVHVAAQAVSALRWGRRFARGRNSACHVLVVASGRERRAVEQLPFQIDGDDDHPDDCVRAVRTAVASDRERPPSLRWLRAADPSEEIMTVARELGCEVIMIAVRDRLQSDNGTHNWVRHILAEAPQHVMLLRAGRESEREHGRMLVAAAGGVQARVALQLAAGAVRESGGTLSLSALFVERPGSPEAEQVGAVHLQKVLQQAGVGPDAGVASRVVVANSVRDAINEEAQRDYDLVLVGATGDGFASSVLFGTFGDHLLTADPPLSVAVVRRARPLTNRLWLYISQFTRGNLPQLTRDQRLSLAEHLESGSRTTVDYIILMASATAIAGFGLLQSSAAVIIGAMLVAPLMTPLMGIGLSLSQGNFTLLRTGAASLMWGFVTALAIGIAQGAVVPGMDLTAELLGRTGPSALDWAVAFVSGVAGAYAASRPGLMAALPGVAIAAALVPPIATVGICLSRGHFEEMFGATLLFSTNVVAIVLGSALALSAVGMGVRRPGADIQRWVRRLSAGLIVAASLLLVVLGSVQWSHRSMELSRHETRELATALPAGCRLDQVLLRYDEDHHRVLQVRILAAGEASTNIEDQIARALQPWAQAAEIDRLQLDLQQVYVVDPLAAD